MRQIIDGYLYDTENSELIHEEKDTKRRIFKTKHGNFFRAFRNGSISPMQEEDVKEYLGTKDIDKYIEIFGNPQEA